MVKEYLPKYVKKYDIDFVIANGENVTHGKGLIQKHYQELLDAGIDCITLGNHYNSKNEINRYIDSADRLVRPVNLLNGFRGDGSVVFELDGLEDGYELEAKSSVTFTITFKYSDEYKDAVRNVCFITASDRYKKEEKILYI